MLARTHDDNVLGLLNVADENVFVFSSVTVFSLDVAFHAAIDLRYHNVW
jgi:hypothetical protein